MVRLIERAVEAMNGFEEFLHALSGKMTTPTLYGLFHVLSVVLMIVISVVICSYLYKGSDKKFRIVVGICWGIVFLLEVYKQLIYSFEWTGSAAEWDYQWYAFPFQLCSLQLYVLPFVFLCKDGHLRDAAAAFLATYSMFGGLAVFIYPGDVFVSTIGINIQTMVHHGFQIVLAVLFMMRYRDKLSLKFFLKGAAMFVALIGVALILNAVIPPFIGDETFNMFYISWQFDCTLPVLSGIYPHVPYPVFLALYVIGLSIAAFIIMMAGKGVIALVRRVNQRIAAAKCNE